jgi:uridylate kinase
LSGTPSGGQGPIVLKISGSLVYPPKEAYLKSLRAAVRKLVETYGKVGLVVGGGGLARQAIEALSPLREENAILDIIGINASRFNALVVAATLYPLSPLSIADTIEKALEYASVYPVVVMGGLQPGQSTNAVAASLAEALGARVILNLLKGVDGVYTPAPGVPGSRRVERLSYTEMRRIIENMEQTPGYYTLFDRVALDLVERSHIKVVFTDGTDPLKALEALEGRRPRTILEAEC